MAGKDILLAEAERELALAHASHSEEARKGHYERAGAYFDRFYRGDSPYEHHAGNGRLAGA